jgi:Tol biopolymer transport system component/DNA-binding winged helix-turn-helix (wHTH) protein
MSGKIRFGVYDLDRDAMELRKHGVLIRLQDQPFRVLAILAGRPGEIVTREELQEQIWGNVFVDFDQSLNKAVNRVREALNDNAGTPQYVETVPRRGYRFIAPVAVLPQAEALDPAVPVNPGAAPAPAHPSSHRTPSRAVIAVLAACLLAAIGIAIVALLRQPKKPTFQEARHLTSFGFEPTLSRDGKLLAYTSSVGDNPLHVWLQQTAGGEATPMTSGSYPDFSPDLSPDGTRIAFSSTRNGGGIYIVPTVTGEPRQLVVNPTAAFPRFSPNGDTILYWQDQKAFTVSVDGGQPVSLPLNQDFRLHGPAFWSAGGSEILFYGVHSLKQNEAANWWIAPLAAGQARLAHLPGAERNYDLPYAVRGWLRTADDREWIIYTTTNTESWKLWRIGVSRRGAIDDKPELLVSGNGQLALCCSMLGEGKLAYSIWGSSVSIYQIPISDRSQKLGATVQLPLPEGGSYGAPSLSRDGRWMAYDSFQPGKPNTILLRDLRNGTDHFLDDKGRRPGVSRETSISPDGSRVLFERDCKEGRFPDALDNPNNAFPCGFMVAAAGGEPEQICERCTPRGFSSDGSLVLLQKYDQADFKKDRIVTLDLRTRTEHDFLSLPDRPLYHPFFSWDDRWVVFKKLQWSALSETAQILIAPVRHGSAAGEAEWIAVTDGRSDDDKPQFSADGNTVYFTSLRDGYDCIWAQRLDPVTKHPIGQPLAFEHFHNAAGRAFSVQRYIQSDLSVARDKIVIDLAQIHGDIWMAQMH